MASSLWWFYDILTVAIIIMAVYGGAKKGFSKVITTLLCYAISIMIAYTAAASISPIIYDSYLRTDAIEAYAKQIKDYSMSKQLKQALDSQLDGITIDEYRITYLLDNENQDIVSGIHTVILTLKPGCGLTADEARVKIATAFINTFTKDMYDEIPGFMLKNLEDILLSSNASLTNVLHRIYFSRDASEIENTATDLVDAYSRKTAVSLMLNLCFVIVFLVATLITLIFLYPRIQIDPYLLPKSLNVLCGGFLGIVEGTVVAFLMCLIVRTLVLVGDNEMMFININTIDETILFRLIYKIDILMLR